MKKRALTLLIIITMFFIAGFSCLQFNKAHTFTLSENSAEQIQPITGTVRVSGTQDTDIWFIDAKNPDARFQIGYITPGMSETIKLKRGRWYKVRGSGELTIRMINVRIE